MPSIPYSFFPNNNYFHTARPLQLLTPPELQLLPSHKLLTPQELLFPSKTSYSVTPRLQQVIFFLHTPTVSHYAQTLFTAAHVATSLTGRVLP